jgi:tetratricopeptide (TPR) repeat protein
VLKKTTIVGLSVLACAVLTVFAIVAKSSHQDFAPRPLSKSELLALVAGQSMPENIIYEIRTHGLLFTPTSTYKSLLETAGADPRILSALTDARITTPKQPEPADDSVLLQQLSQAGKLLNAGQLDDSANQLTNAMNNGLGRLELGFVMGMVLMDKNRYEEAGQIYSEIMDRDPAFPQVHTRLSNTYYNSGDFEEGLRHAKAAEERNPEDMSAHMNAGNSLIRLRQFDAAKSELLAAIRIKPDLGLAYENLAILLGDSGQQDAAIEQFKKALALALSDTERGRIHYGLGVAYERKNDYASAIREYREVKRLDPKNGDARQNLASALMRTDPGASITEWRDLVALYPDRPICHDCLGDALYSTGRYDEAKNEYQIGLQIDPGSPRPHTGLGRLWEVNKNYDEALKEYRSAEQLDPTFGGAFTDAGRVLVLKKDFSTAIKELKVAEGVEPTSWTNHDLRGQALEGAGDRDAAIAEYTEALSIAPKELQARLDLALAQQKKGDWIAALRNYRQAATDEPPPKPGFSQINFDAAHKYASAQQSFAEHLTELRASNRAAEAADLEARLRSSTAKVGVDDEYHVAMNASAQAMAQRRFDAAATSAQQAIKIAEKVQPQDGRLPEAVGQLGNVYAWRLDYKNAEAAYKRQLLLYQTLYGAESPMSAPAVQNLAMLALAQKDFARSAVLFSQALDLNQKTYGENSTAVAETLRGLAHVYSAQHDYPKAEAAYLHVVSIDETMYGTDDNRLAIPLTTLCSLYDQWGKPDKSQSCHARLVSLEEKQFGSNSPYLVRDLTAEANALRQLGRTDEASQIERRTQTIQSAQSAQTNPN